MLKKGNHVVYGGSEICVVSDIVKRCFDGVNEENYLKLVPVETPSASYYVPEKNAEERVRHLMGREQVLAVIDAMPLASAQWSENRDERRHMFVKVLKSDDYMQILSMMKGLYDEKQKRGACGKDLISADEKAFEAASKLINKEFSMVLDIPEAGVDGFIEQRLAMRHTQCNK